MAPSESAFLLDSSSLVGQKVVSLMNRLRSDAGEKSTYMSSYQIAMQTVNLLQLVVKESK